MCPKCRCEPAARFFVLEFGVRPNLGTKNAGHSLRRPADRRPRRLSPTNARHRVGRENETAISGEVEPPAASFNQLDLMRVVTL